MATNEMKIYLGSIDAVKNFNAIIGKIDGDMDICHGRYTIDAKSIMGIFSLDLSKPLTLIVRSGDVEKVKEAVKDFTVE